MILETAISVLVYDVKDLDCGVKTLIFTLTFTADLTVLRFVHVSQPAHRNDARRTVHP